MLSLFMIAMLATGPMTLAEIEAMAMANNPLIRDATQKIRVAEAQVRTSSAIEDPEFSYRGWSVPVLQPWNMNQAQHMFMLTQKIPAKGTRELRRQVASDDVKLQELAVETARREVLAAARRAFHKLLLANAQLQVHHEQVALARQTTESVRIRYIAGQTSQQDVLRAQIAFAQLAEHEVMFETEADIARTELNSLMGRSPDQALEITGEYSPPGQLPSLAELREIAMKHRPELAALQLMLEQGQHKIELAGQGYKPEYSVTAGYMLMPSGSMSRNAWMGEMSVSLPWLNRSKHDAEVLVAQASTAAISTEYSRLFAAISEDIRKALIQTEAARKIAALYADILRPQLQNASRAATIAYQNEKSSLTNVLDSQAATLDLEHSRLAAMSEYEQRLTDLERAIGTSIPQLSADGRIQ